MKVGNGGISAMQKAIDFLKGMLDYEKLTWKDIHEKAIDERRRFAGITV